MLRKSIWIKNVSNIPSFPKLMGKLPKVDVAIVGGGVVGLSAAVHLKEAGKKVAIIEGSKIGQGVTGNSTGKLSHLHKICYAPILKLFGEDGLRKHVEYNQRGIKIVENLCNSYDIDCDFSYRPNYTYTTSDSHIPAIKAEVEAAQKVGVKASFTTETDLPYSVKAAIRVEDQAQFNPAQFCIELSNKICGEGCDIFEESRVLSISGINGPHIIKTNEGEIEADFVVVSTHLPILDRSGHFTVLKPSRSYCMAFHLTDDTKMTKGMYISQDSPTHSIRTCDRDRVLVIAGHDHSLGKPHYGQTHEDNYIQIERFARKNWPIKDVICRWSSFDYMSSEKVPYIGYLHHGTTTAFGACGFSKWGLAAGISGGSIISDLIQGKESPYLSLIDARRWDLTKITPLVQSAAIQAIIAKDFVKDRIEGLVSGDIEELANDMGAICKYKGKIVAGYKDETGKIYAVSPTCQHLGCYVKYNDAERTWDCPCHGSIYDVEGNILHGPAVHPLPNKLEEK